MYSLYEFVKRRFGEASTWTHIGTAVAAAAAVPAPACYLIFICNVVGVLTPDQQLLDAWKKAEGAQ